MKSLKALKHLNLKAAVCLKMIPLELISNLSNLKILNMSKLGFIEIDSSMLIEELLHLNDLCELSFTVKTASFLKRICSDKKLLNFVHAIDLRYFNRKPLDISSLANSKNLHILDIAHNTNVEEFIIEAGATHGPSSNLKNNLSIFCGLHEVDVNFNRHLRHLTWLIFAPHLTILRASYSENMVEIISAKKLREHQAGVEDSKLFEKLQVLELDSLPKLNIICLNAQSFPSLIQITVKECSALKQLPLNSNSAEGCDDVIKGKKSWCDKLAWEDDETKSAF